MCCSSVNILRKLEGKKMPSGKGKVSIMGDNLEDPISRLKVAVEAAERGALFL